MSALPRDLDVIVWGATGFTGQLVTAALAGYQPDFYSCKLPNPGTARAEGATAVRYALAGRNSSKLQDLKARVGCSEDVELLAAEAADEDALAAIVRRTRVIIATAGPFKSYSDVIVGLCAKHGTHYVDITGEVAWVRSVIDRYDDVAKSTGAVICSMCGFDSIPFDLGTLFAVNRLRERTRSSSPASSIRRVVCLVPPLVGGFSGGSLATGISNTKTPVQLTAGVDQMDPFLLGGRPAGGTRPEDEDKAIHAVREIGGGGAAAGGQAGPVVLAGPSGMHTINSRVVRRSAGLLGFGPRFNFVELTPAANRKQAERLSRAMTHPIPTEKMLEMVAKGRLPKPGEGPTAEVRRRARFVTVIDCEADDGARLVATMRGGECGYEETSRMVLEAALALAKTPHLCPGVTAYRGGCLTPAAALGETLISRLTSIGMPFAVETGTAAEVVAAELAKQQQQQQQQSAAASSANKSRL